MTNLYGRPKTGKSFCVLDMAAAIATPTTTSWNGFAVLKHGPVAYLQVDTPRSEWGDRVEKMKQLKKDFSNVAFADMQMVPTYPFNILDPGAVAWLKAELQRIQPVLVVIDTLRDIHGLDENDSTAMRNVIAGIVSCSLPVGAAVIFLSHQKKDSAFMKAGGDDLMDDARGSSYVSGRMDNIIRLTQTRLTYKGRSGAGDVCITQDEDTHLIILDGDAQKENEAVQRVITRERGLDPAVTMKDCATALRVELAWDAKKQKTAERRVKSYFKAMGW